MNRLAVLLVVGLLAFADQAMAQVGFYPLPFRYVPVSQSAHDVTGVSGDGNHIVGTEHFPGNHEATKWSWTPPPPPTILAPVDQDTAHAASQHGKVVVGRTLTLVPWHNNSQYIPWMFTSLGGRQPLLIPGGFTGGIPYGVSGSGDQAVGSVYGDSVKWTAVRWDLNNGQPQLLGYLGSSPLGSVAREIDDTGTLVCGSADYLNNGNFVREAFLWTQFTGILGLGFAPTHTTSEAEDISADGLAIVGRSGDEACIWNSYNNYQPTPMGFLAGSTYSDAAGVSNGGRVAVGRSGNQAFIWTPWGGMRDMNQFLNYFNINTQGWTLSHPTAIDNAGRTIVGVDISPQGYGQGWMVRLPRYWYFKYPWDRRRRGDDPKPAF